MKVIASGDNHIGKRHVDTYPHVNRVEVTVRVLYDMLHLCKVHGCLIMILNGDLLDKAYPDLETLLEVYRALQFIRAEGVTVYWVRGNHEVYINSQLDRNVMHLFHGICQVVTEPQSICSDTTAIVMVPWYPDPKMMKKLYDEAALLVRADKRTCLLFTHVGLAEGRISPSNMMLPQPIATVDLHPECWDAVFLSDYHEHQMLGGGNVCYMGAPIPHTFGDSGQVGVWLLDTDRNDYEPIDLRDGPVWDGLPPFERPRYPRFQRWSGADSVNLPMFPIDPRDYNEVRVHPNHIAYYKSLYPTARVLPVDGTEDYAPTVLVDGVRLKKDDVHSISGLVEAWLNYKQVTTDREALFQVGMELLS